jgi:hypothetical protein
VKRISCAALAALLAVAGGSAFADSTITGALVKLTAKPAQAKGACPQTVAFDGYIAVYGTFEPGHPVEFATQFLRSDGMAGPVSYFTVSMIGKHTVSDTWTLGGGAQTSYSGWEQVKVWPTAHPGGPGTTLGEKAAFTMTCQERLSRPAVPPQAPPAAVLNLGH